ncbi:hypothetical protein [Rickettsiella endosymbiont of Dermanyssus gallinae]|uniref:hypothetical protein n=1 Tax=Rickettsiella endosymbiont of Dermanyssus gallinae TaxID=2856608 RepID=UPI001C5272A9|nr:hypothetical protein [Rickettsiella endosymbiont of Dermanyssus gallinae]
MTQETNLGLFGLDTTKQDKALSKHFQPLENYQSQYLNAQQTGMNPLHYFVNQKDKAIVLATPVDTANLSAYLDILIKHLALENLDDYHVVIPLIGKGITERHIVSYYKAPGAESIPMIFDSKTGNLAGFFNVKKNSVAPNISYCNLGTQSFFDSVTCGYHTLINTANIVSLIQDGKKVNTASLLKALKKTI